MKPLRIGNRMQKKIIDSYSAEMGNTHNLVEIIDFINDFYQKISTQRPIDPNQTSIRLPDELEQPELPDAIEL